MPRSRGTGEDWEQIILPWEEEYPDDEVTPTLPSPPVIIMPPDFNLTPEWPDEYALVVPEEQCEEPHPIVGEELLCEEEKDHEGIHSKHAKGELWQWKTK